MFISSVNHLFSKFSFSFENILNIYFLYHAKSCVSKTLNIVFITFSFGSIQEFFSDAIFMKTDFKTIFLSL